MIGYKHVPSSYSKYLLEFEGGKREAFMPSFLRGPFVSSKIASKYGDDNVKIDLKDLRSSGVKVRSIWQLDKKLEAFLKDLLTQEPFNFVWNDQEEIVEQDESITTLLLGYHKVYKDLLKVVRVNKSVSKGFAKGGYYVYLPKNIVDCSLGYKGEIPLKNFIQQVIESYKPLKSPYLLEQIQKEVRKHDFKAFLNCFETIKQGNLLSKEQILQGLKHFEVKPKTLNLNMWFSLYLDHLKDKTTFEGYTIEDVNVKLSQSVSSSNQEPLSGCPSKIGGKFSLNPHPLQGSCVIGSLRGGPEVVEGDFEVDSGVVLKSLEGAPKQIGGKFKCEQFSDADYREYLKFQELRKKLPELEGIFS